MIFDVLTDPAGAFARMGERRSTLGEVLVKRAVWLGLIPPVSAFVGTATQGWHLGIGEPLQIPYLATLAICVAYYLLLLGGFVAAVFVMRWMAPTYDADTSLGSHAALIAAAGTPLMIGGLAHLYPQIGVNLMLLVPAMIWSTYLLYTGLPVVLKTGADRGMLMATSMLGVFFVAANALMMLTMFLWTMGLGPDLGFNWRFSVAG